MDIAGRMGHESIDITLHYAHMFPSAQKDMANKLNMEGYGDYYVPKTKGGGKAEEKER